MLHLYQTSTRRLILSCPPWPPCSYIARNICAFSIWLLFWKYPSLLTFSNCSCFSPSSPFSNCDSLTHPEPPLPTHTYNPPSQETHFCPLQNLSWPPYPSQFLWKQLHSYFTNIPSFLDCQTHIFWSGHLNVRYLAWLIFFNDFLKPSPSFSWSFGWSLTHSGPSPHFCPPFSRTSQVALLCHALLPLITSQTALLSALSTLLQHFCSFPPSQSPQRHNPSGSAMPCCHASSWSTCSLLPRPPIQLVIWPHASNPAPKLLKSMMKSKILACKSPPINWTTLANCLASCK